MQTINPLLQKALTCLQAGDMEGAVPQLLAWADGPEVPAPACLQMGVALDRLGRPQAAQVLYRRGLQEDPAHLGLTRALGLSLLTEGKAVEALPYLASAAQGAPDDAVIGLQWALALKNAGRPSEALAVLERISASGPHAAGVHHLRTLILWQSGRLQEAFISSLEAKAYGGNNPEITQTHLQMLAEIKGLESAQRALVNYLRWSDPRPTAERQADLARLGPAPALRIQTRPRHDRQVVFVAEDPRIRHAKMARGLRDAGWDTVLLHKLTPNFPVQDYFGTCHRYRTEGEALELATDFSPRAFHLCAIWGDPTSAFFLEHKPGPCVYDTWDVVEGLRLGDPIRELQRWCIAQADGLCCRDLRSRWVEGALRPRMHAKRILFQDYCWDDPMPDVPRLEGLHAVSCGYVGVRRQGDSDSSYLRIAQAFADQGIHLHLYPHPSQEPFEELMADYLELAARTPFFHLHRPVPMEDVVHELRHYRLGVTLMDGFTFGGEPQLYSRDYLRRWGSARLFDFLDAGLPVLHNRELSFQFRMLKRFGLVIDAGQGRIRDLRRHLETFLAPDMDARVAKARTELSIRRQIPRLIAFYENL